MRPLHLTMQAFGPFAECEVIDFSNFPDRAPFSISGPTGAGKTTVLDALCLALFGETSGGERKATETRSQHADDKLPTEVALVFTLGGDTWRVTRRPGRRLDGRSEAQSVQLDRQLDRQLGANQWQPCGQRVAEVDNKIKELLGFDVEQFRQVVVLPQGGFRQLLTANSTQREGILKQLFGTHLYERIQRSLTEQADSLDRDFKLLAAKRQALLAAQGVQTPLELAQLQVAAAENLLAAQAHTLVSAGLRQASEAALRVGQADAQVLRERTNTAQKLEEHQAQSPMQQQREAVVAAAHRAQQAAPQVRLAAAASEQQQRANDLMAAAQTARNTLQPQAEVATHELERQRGRSGEHAKLLAQAGQLDALVGKVAVLDATRAKSAELNQNYASAKAASLSAQTKVKQLEPVVPELLAEHGRLHGLAAGLAGQQAAVEKLLRVKKLHGDVQQVMREVQSLQVQAGSAEKALQVAALDTQQALAAYDQCHGAWVRGQAARLAIGLKDHEACAVCGSLDHPAPAVADGVLPTDQQLDTAKQVYDQALELVSQRRATGLALAAKLEAAQQAQTKAQVALAAEDLDPQLASEAAIQRAQTAVIQAKAAKDHLPSAHAKAEQANVDLDQARKDQTQAEAFTADLGAKAAMATQAVHALEADLPEQLRTATALQAAQRECDRAAKSIQAALAAAELRASDLKAQLAGAQGALQTQELAHATAQHEAAKAAVELEQALRNQGFATLAAWQEAQKESAALAALQQAIDVWRSKLDQLHGLAEKAAETAAGVAEPDLQTLGAAAEVAKTADNEAQHASATWQGKVAQLNDTHKILDDLAAKSGDLEARYAVVKHLAANCNGENPKGLPLQRFVLAGLLDDVLRAANLRLGHMTRGRYALLRKEEITDRRRAFGLDLEVLDAYTGQQRPATTLSGGEGFLASLALALGLSDVVQGYTGGIRLDALFIDEGFGTLDPETLELAIKALVELTAGPNAAGRLVGVISHVPELKARLAKGIEVEVRADGKGSRVRVVV